MKSYNNTIYTIISASDVENIDFNQVEQTSENSLRFSKDSEYALLKFKGETPSFLEGISQYSHSEIITILNNTSGIWYIENNAIC